MRIQEHIVKSGPYSGAYTSKTEASLITLALATGLPVTMPAYNVHLPLDGMPVDVYKNDNVSNTRCRIAYIGEKYWWECLDKRDEPNGKWLIVEPGDTWRAV